MEGNTYAVVRTTADKLEEKLNSLREDGRELVTTQWLGGRDWMIIAGPAPTGWVDAQRDNHVRLAEYVQEHGSLPPDMHPGFYTGLIDPEVQWGNIRYGRYDQALIGTREFTGWVEDVAKTWIIFLGPHGAPKLYWPRRDEGGGVIGEAIDLTG